MSNVLTLEEKLKTAFLNETQKICRELAPKLNLEFEPNAVELTSELAWKKLGLYGSDLEQFARHGKRSVINADDVKLLVRRNPSLKSHLMEIDLQTTSTSKDSKKKKKDTKN